MLGWLSDRAKGRGFEPRPWRCCATTLTQVVHTPLPHSRDTPRGGLNYLSNQNQNRMYQDSLIKAKACAHQINSWINYGLRQGGQQCWALWGFSGSLPLCVTHQFLFGRKRCLLACLRLRLCQLFSNTAIYTCRDWQLAYLTLYIFQAVVAIIGRRLSTQQSTKFLSALPLLLIYDNRVLIKAI